MPKSAVFFVNCEEIREPFMESGFDGIDLGIYRKLEQDAFVRNKKIKIRVMVVYNPKTIDAPLDDVLSLCLNSLEELYGKMFWKGDINIKTGEMQEDNEEGDYGLGGDWWKND